MVRFFHGSSPYLDTAFLGFRTAQQQWFVDLSTCFGRTQTIRNIGQHSVYLKHQVDQPQALESLEQSRRMASLEVFNL